jgi:hypothetical protein
MNNFSMTEEGKKWDAQQLEVWGKKIIPTEKYKEFREHPVGKLSLELTLEEMRLKEEGLL